MLGLSASNLKEKFNKLRVLIIGDVMIDSYVWGESNRMSSEAPVSIVEIKEREKRLGGAANVALNVKSLGAKPMVCSIIGNDTYGDEFVNLLTAQQLRSDRIIRNDTRKTTVKTRVFSKNKQLLRVDEESKHEASNSETLSLKGKITHIIHEVDLIIFEDYDKGVITKELIEFTISRANSMNIPVIVDPKKQNFLNFKGVSLFKPNLKEVQEGLGISITADLNNLKEATKLLNEKLTHKDTLITLSDAGVFYATSAEAQIIEAHKRKIVDVSGAGDTVIAVAALSYAIGLPMKEVAAIANVAGGLVCEKIGVMPIQINELLQELIRLKLIS